MHFILPLPIIMFFIASSIFILGLIMSAILYNACIDLVIPMCKRSRHFRRFITRISHAIYTLFLEIRNDAFYHMENLCESDGEVEEEDDIYYDYQFEISPSCDIVKSPPQEEIRPDPNNNSNAAGRGRGGVRARPRRRVAAVAGPRREPPVIRFPGLLPNQRAPAVVPQELRNVAARMENVAELGVQLEELGEQLELLNRRIEEF